MCPSEGRPTHSKAGVGARLAPSATPPSRLLLWLSSSVVLMLVAAIGWLVTQSNGRGIQRRSSATHQVTARAPLSVASGIIERSHASGVPVPRPSHSRDIAGTSPFASERDYWDEVERLAAVDPAQALQLALDGERWYSDRGRPAEARRAMIVSLLVEFGRMSEAREWTRRFIEQYPESSYRPLVQGKTGIHPRPGPDGRMP